MSSARTIKANTDSVHLTLAQLLRLASPALPVGAYSYSQALEWAVESGQVRDSESAARWILDSLSLNFARCEAPVWVRLYSACARGESAEFSRWNDFFVATREASELRAETLQMGKSLRSLLLQGSELPKPHRDLLENISALSYPAAFACAAAGLNIAARAALTAYLFSWAENQVLAAVKLVPLGQIAAQNIIGQLIAELPFALEAAFECEDDDIGALSFGLAIASCRHETQYSRLFRS